MVNPFEQRSRPKVSTSTSKTNPIASFIRSLHNDVLINAHLPSTKSNNYASVTRTLSFVPVAGTGPAASLCSFAVNPWLVPVGNLSWNQVLAGAIVNPSLAAAFTNTGACATPFPLTVAGQSILKFTETPVDSTAFTNFAGRIRVIGVRVRIDYTGTVANEGGTLTIYHGGGRDASIYSRSIAAPYWGTPFTTSTTLTNSATFVTTSRMGARSEFVWRPREYEFNNVETFLSDEVVVASVGLTTSGPDILNKYFGDEYADNNGAESGWAFGFTLSNAVAVAAGVAMPYLVNVDIITHEDTWQCGSAILPNVAFRRGDTPSYRNTLLADSVANHLAKVHSTRARNPMPTNIGKPLATAATNAAMGAMEEAGSMAMAKLAAAF